jgi:AraC-like DNA-binding protein
VSYREHGPPAALAPWLACVWQRRGEAGPPVRVLPDGCIDIVWTEGAGTQLVGANTSAFLVPVAPGTRVVGARLRPGAAPALLGIDGREVRDTRAALDEVLGDDGRRLVEALAACQDPVTALLAALAARAPRAAPPDPLVAAAVARLGVRADTVTTLAAELGLSERQLHRRVVSAVGYGPKRLARVLRLERALAAARAGQELARVAADAGYADQAHFSGDCRELAGVPPSALLA